MAELTTKELCALEDQLGFEQMCVSKYRTAAAETGEQKLKNCFEQQANQHQQNFNTLLTFLK